MKKIGLWMAALTAVTVGGVYATFDYANNFNFEKSGDITIDLQPANPTGGVGQFEVDTSAFKIVIDSAQSVVTTHPDLADELVGFDTHTPVMLMSGSITFTFKPSANAETAIANNGLEATFSFSTADANPVNTWTYTAIDEGEQENPGTQILQAFNTLETKIYPQGTTGQKYTWKNTDGVITCTINAGDLYSPFDGNNENDLLLLNPVVVLGTQQEHANYKEGLKDKVITVTIISGTGNTVVHS